MLGVVACRTTLALGGNLLALSLSEKHTLPFVKQLFVSLITLDIISAI
jgi:hypothetical protein